MDPVLVARLRYEDLATLARMFPDQHPKPYPACARCQWASLQADAASLAYDLSVAQACDERTLVVVP